VKGKATIHRHQVTNIESRWWMGWHALQRYVCLNSYLHVGVWWKRVPVVPRDYPPNDAVSFDRNSFVRTIFVHRLRKGVYHANPTPRPCNARLLRPKILAQLTIRCTTARAPGWEPPAGHRTRANAETRCGSGPIQQESCWGRRRSEAEKPEAQPDMLLARRVATQFHAQHSRSARRLRTCACPSTLRAGNA